MHKLKLINIKNNFKKVNKNKMKNYNKKNK